ncbi:hypothetical protein D3C85_1922630 [compost metagenome]
MCCQLHVKPTVSGTPIDVTDKAHVKSSGQAQDFRLLVIHARQIFCGDMKPVSHLLSDALLL